MTLEEALQGHVAALEGERWPFRAPDAHRRAREYVAAALGGPLWRHPFRADGGDFENLVLRRGEPRLLVGAHFDSVPGTPGADDNASGVAVLIELARANLPGWYVGFDLEEAGMLGSDALVRDLGPERRKVDLMISLEMVGYVNRERGSQRYPPFVGWGRPDRGDFIALVSNPAARGPAARLASCLRRAGVPTETLTVPMKGWFVPAARLSDNAPFWDAGVPALMLTDTSFLRNPNYHSPSDTRETLDYGFMAGIVRGLTDFASGFAAVNPGAGVPILFL